MTQCCRECGGCTQLSEGGIANWRHFIVFSFFMLKTFQKERSIWMVLKIHLKVSSNSVEAWQQCDFTIVIQLPKHPRHPPSTSVVGHWLHAQLPTASWTSLVSRKCGMWSVPKGKSILCIGRNNGCEGSESNFWSILGKQKHPLNHTVDTHMVFHFSSFL
jgi:hypothetical protein